MPSLSVAVPHELGRQEATDRLKAKFGDIRDEFGEHVSEEEQEWNGHLLRFGFKTYGVHIRGTVDSGESQVTITANLPLIAMPMKGAIENRVRSELESILR